MKKIFCLIVFLLFAVPAFAEVSVPYLTNQNGAQATHFENGNEIYIEGFCLPANQEAGKIFIVSDKTWQTNDRFSDVSGSIEFFTGSSDGRIPRTKIWGPYLDQGTYDVAIDTNNDYILQEYEKQCIVGLTGAGFTVGNPAPAPIALPTPEGVGTPTSSVGAAPAPEPAPSAPAKPSTAFSLDEYVEVISLSNIRKSAGGAIIGPQEEGALGIVADGPKRAPLAGKYFWFWKIDFENDPDGWVAESTIKTAPPPIKKTTAEENAKGQCLANTTQISIVKEIPQEETAPQSGTTTENILAQVSAVDKTDKSSGSNPYTGFIIIGTALFLGLIISSVIVAEALKRKS